MVPGFGGLFLDPNDNAIVYVYMADSSQQEAAEESARIILGRERFEQEIREVRVLQAQYSMRQLSTWYNLCGTPCGRWQKSPGLTSTKGTTG